MDMSRIQIIWINGIILVLLVSSVTLYLLYRRTRRRLHATLGSQHELEHYLKKAIREDLFEVVYQPIWSVSEGRFVSMEALTRLRDPAGNYLPTQELILLAEKDGQMGRLSELQLRRVCAFVSANRQSLQGIRKVKFNISPIPTEDIEHCQRMVSIIRDSGLPPELIQFEMTETAVPKYLDRLVRALNIYSQAGIDLCMDDFGSGYANLRSTLDISFTTVKIDRSLLEGIHTDKKVAALYHSCVHMLQDVGYKLIAEGVETKEDAELVNSWGVNLIQGYYFSRPKSEEEILEKLRNNLE